PALGEARQAVVGDGLPGRRVVHELAAAGPDARVAVEGAEAHDHHLAALGVRGEEGRAAVAAEVLGQAAFGLPAAHALLAADDAQRPRRGAGRGGGGSAGAMLAARAVAVERALQRRVDLE